MPAGEKYDRIRRTGAQFLRFMTVGATNTLVDIVVTNVLVLLLKPQVSLTLMMISVTACALATLNSYALNRRWTFRHVLGQAPSRAAYRFFAVALLSMAVNTSTFLFWMKYLPDLVTLNNLAKVNLSKLAGVGAAFSVSFVGYRFGVFETDAIRRFRESFRFPLQSSGTFTVQTLVLLVGSTAVRGAYLQFAHLVYGDAVSYGWVARALAQRDFARADAFWTSLFSWWESLFHTAGASPVTAAILSSFIPGVLIIVPVVWLTRNLFGSTVAWLAGALCVTHPRLVEYSCNGYPETFYTFAFAAAIAFLTRVLRGGGWMPALLAGVALGVFTCVRNEGVLVFCVALAIIVAAGRRKPKPGAAPDPPLNFAAGLAGTTAGFAAVVGAYVLLSMNTVATLGLFQKNPNLLKEYSEQLDMRDAARETYGAQGVLYGPPRPVPSFGSRLALLISRVPRNVMYSMERLPGVLLSPIPLFALLLPIFAGGLGFASAPLLLMLVFPLVFNPLVQIEPRLMHPMLVPLQILGSAGLTAFARYAHDGLGGRRLLAYAGGIVLLISTVLTAWRVYDVKRNYDFHDPLAKWVRANIPADETVIGCGYGYVSTTGFMADRRTTPRIWTDSPQELAGFACGRRARWIIIYERFVQFANPELQPVFDSGIPGFGPVYQVTDHRGYRTQVFRKDSNY
jgi:putative flippase GtrA